MLLLSGIMLVVTALPDVDVVLTSDVAILDVLWLPPDKMLVLVPETTVDVAVAPATVVISFEGVGFPVVATVVLVT